MMRRSFLYDKLYDTDTVFLRLLFFYRKMANSDTASTSSTMDISSKKTIIRSALTNLGFCSSISQCDILEAIKCFLNNSKNTKEFNVTDTDSLIIHSTQVTQDDVYAIDEALIKIATILSNENRQVREILYSHLMDQTFIESANKSIVKIPENDDDPMNDVNIDEIFTKLYNDYYKDQDLIQSCNLLLENLKNVGPLQKFWISTKQLVNPRETDTDTYLKKNDELDKLYRNAIETVASACGKNIIFQDLDLKNQGGGILNKYVNDSVNSLIRFDEPVPGLTYSNFAIGSPLKVIPLKTTKNYNAYINHHYKGAPRLWLIISKTHVSNMITRLKKVIEESPEPSDEVKKCDMPIFHYGSILMSPSWLKNNNIDYNIFVQYPGETVFLREFSYYQVIDLGFNVTEYICYGTQLDSCFDSSKLTCQCDDGPDIYINSNTRASFRIVGSSFREKCPYCTQSNRLYTISSLRIHIKANHSDDNRYKCLYCNFTSNNKTRFLSHEKTHKVKYECFLCYDGLLNKYKSYENIYRHYLLYHKFNFPKMLVEHPIFDILVEKTFKHKFLNIDQKNHYFGKLIKL